MKTFKIGEEITIKEDFKINTIVSDKVMTVKKGDKGFVDSKGFIHLTSGSCRGKIVKINDVEIKGYDFTHITNLIYSRLQYNYDLTNLLENEDITKEQFKEEIEDVLMDIL